MIEKELVTFKELAKPDKLAGETLVRSACGHDYLPGR